MPLTEILTCIQKNYHNPVFDVNLLHRSTKESASHSRLKFKREYGCSLHEMVETLRVALALEWLAENAIVTIFPAEYIAVITVNEQNLS